MSVLSCAAIEILGCLKISNSYDPKVVSLFLAFGVRVKLWSDFLPFLAVAFC